MPVSFIPLKERGVGVGKKKDPRVDEIKVKERHLDRLTDIKNTEWQADKRMGKWVDRQSS